MMAGLPGTGIGGLFYMLTALWMPFREMGRTCRGQSSAARWSAVGRQGAIALGAIASAWMTGWLLALIIPESWLNGRIGNNILRVAPIILQAMTLGVVFAGVHTLRLLTRRRLHVVLFLGLVCASQPLCTVALAEGRSPVVHVPARYDVEHLDRTGSRLVRGLLSPLREEPREFPDEYHWRQGAGQGCLLPLPLVTPSLPE